MTILSVPRHLEIADAAVAAAKADRAFPIRKTRSHPTPGIQWDGFDLYSARRNGDAPLRWHLAVCNLGLCRRIHADIR